MGAVVVRCISVGALAGRFPPSNKAAGCASRNGDRVNVHLLPQPVTGSERSVDVIRGSVKAKLVFFFLAGPIVHVLTHSLPLG